MLIYAIDYYFATLMPIFSRCHDDYAITPMPFERHYADICQMPDYAIHFRFHFRHSPLIFAERHYAAAAFERRFMPLILPPPPR
jgi:hypothetical protein